MENSWRRKTEKEKEGGEVRGGRNQRERNLIKVLLTEREINFAVLMTIFFNAVDDNHCTIFYNES